MATDARSFHLEAADNGSRNSVAGVRVDGPAPRLHSRFAHGVGLSGTVEPFLGTASFVCNMGKPPWMCRAGARCAWSRNARRIVGGCPSPRQSTRHGNG